MAKTRSQTGNPTIKKEEDGETNLLLNSVSNTRSTNRIVKREPSPHTNSLSAQKVKEEEGSDTKSLLEPLSRLPTRQRVSQEQINQLIRYIVNDNIGLPQAACKVNIGHTTAIHYYNAYKNHPEKKIPLPRTQTSTFSTQEQIRDFIKYVNIDKMTVKEASKKANVTHDSARRYYNKYLEDPDHNIPVPQLSPAYSKDQIAKFISYLVDDKMSIKDASIKANLTITAGKKYYRKHFKQHPGIPIPSQIYTPKYYTKEQIKDAINYIVKDKMSIKEASIKAKISVASATRYYHQYSKDNNIKLPVTRIYYTQDDINKVIGYMANGNMTIREAAKKVNMNPQSAAKYYQQYLKNKSAELLESKKGRICTQKQIKKLIGYIFNNKMTLVEASEKANMCSSSGRKYYHQYLKDHHMDLPVPKQFTQEDLDQLVGYIDRDKMTILAASKKVNMCIKTARKYYHRYLNEQKA
jgi:transposase